VDVQCRPRPLSMTTLYWGVYREQSHCKQVLKRETKQNMRNILCTGRLPRIRTNVLLATFQLDCTHIHVNYTHSHKYVSVIYHIPYIKIITSVVYYTFNGITLKLSIHKFATREQRTINIKRCTL